MNYYSFIFLLLYASGWIEKASGSCRTVEANLLFNCKNGSEACISNSAVHGNSNSDFLKLCVLAE